MDTDADYSLDAVYNAYEADPNFETLRSRATQLVPGCGNLTPEIVLVGEAPGSTEDKTGIPFSGRAGKLLDEMLHQVDLDRADLFITNIVKYRPLSNNKNRKPTAREIEASKAYLREELLVLAAKSVRPPIVALMGDSALSAVFGSRFSITQVAGRAMHGASDGWLIFPMLHPAVGLYTPLKVPKMIEHFRNLKALADHRRGAE